MTTSRLFLLCGLVLFVCGLVACDAPQEAPRPSAEVPVRTEVLEASSFRPSVRLLGRVEPSSRVALRPEATGEIRYPPRFAAGLRTGERVEAGETLFTIVDPDRRLALEEAKLDAELAEAKLERTRQGVEGGFLPSSDWKQAEIQARLARQRLANAEDDVERLEMRAPVAGVLRVDRAVPAGTRVSADQELASLAAADGLRVEAWAAAADLERLAAALAEGPVPAHFLAPGSRELLGRGDLAEVAREVGEGGVGRVVVEVTEDLAMPQVGDGVEVKLLLAERQGVITVPERALVVHGNVATVYVLEPLAEGYRARARQVILGARHDGRVEIVDGLSGGETVAVEGAELLADGLPAVDAEDELP